MFIDNASLTEEHIEISWIFQFSSREEKKSFSKLWWRARATRAEDSQGIPNVRILLGLRSLLLEILLPFSIFSSIFGVETWEIREVKKVGTSQTFRPVQTWPPPGSLSSQAHFLPGLVCVFVTSEKFAEKKTEGQPKFRKILLLLIWNKMSNLKKSTCLLEKIRQSQRWLKKRWHFEC